MRWIDRIRLQNRIDAGLAGYPITLLLGPRQCGKTSMARRISASRQGTYFDLESPDASLRPESAMTQLRDLKGLVVIDEVQREPHLFELLRVLADRRPIAARFLILGSATPSLVKGVSESLAGRVAYVDMAGLTVEECGTQLWQTLWLRGGFPHSFLADDNKISYEWRMNFIQSFLERDIPQLGIRVPANALRRFWTMLAHYHAQPWNGSELARTLGVKPDTARHYLDILSGAFMVRQLMPWFENTGKRLVKAPRVYFRDTGLLHALLSLTTPEQLLSHPQFGFSWEGFALEEIIRALNADQDAYFYRTQSGAELDLVLLRGGRRYGFEFKFSDRPRTSRSMRIAMADLALKQLWIVYPGERAFPLDECIEALPLARAPELAKRLED